MYVVKVYSTNNLIPFGELGINFNRFIGKHRRKSRIRRYVIHESSLF